jgi:hypothetical protein
MEQAMTKVLKLLSGGSLAVALGMILFASGAFSATSVSAESPPSPPARFVGSVTVEGAPATAGTLIELRIGTSTCGNTSVFMSGAEARYAVDSPALDPAATPNCGVDGAVVSFYVGGKKANETGVWHNYQLNTVNLTVTTPTPAASTTPGAGTPASTPKPPTTGGGTATGSSDTTAIWLYAALGLGAIAFGVGGTAVARRSR